MYKIHLFIYACLPIRYHSISFAQFSCEIIVQWSVNARAIKMRPVFNFFGGFFIWIFAIKLAVPKARLKVSTKIIETYTSNELHNYNWFLERSIIYIYLLIYLYIYMFIYIYIICIYTRIYTRTPAIFDTVPPCLNSVEMKWLPASNSETNGRIRLRPCHADIIFQELLLDTLITLEKDEKK